MGKNKRGSGSSRKPSGSSGVGGAGSFALGLALGAKPAIKKTHAMSMSAADLASSTVRKRGRGRCAHPIPPSPMFGAADDPGESGSIRMSKKRRPTNPDYEDAYRNLVERTQGQARSKAFHRQGAQKRREQGKMRDGLIAPPTFVNLGCAPALAAVASAGAGTSSVNEFVMNLCVGLEERQEEEANDAVNVHGSGLSEKDKEQVKASAPKTGKNNPFAALGSDDEDAEGGREQSPAVIFQPSMLCPSVLVESRKSQALDEDTRNAEGAPKTQSRGGEKKDNEKHREKEGTNKDGDVWDSLCSMAMADLSSSLLAVEALQPQLVSSSMHEEKEKDDSMAPTSTTSPSLPTFASLSERLTVTKENVSIKNVLAGDQPISVRATGGVTRKSEIMIAASTLKEAPAAEEDFQDL